MVAAAVVVCSVAPGAVLVVSDDRVSQVTAAVHALAAALFCSAGALRYARWRLTGEASVGAAAAALFLVAVLAVPLELASGLLYERPLWQEVSPVSWTVVTPMAVALVWRRHADDVVDSRLRPLSTVGVLAGAALATFALAAVAQHLTGVLLDPPVAGVQAASWAASGLWWVVAAVHARRVVRQGGGALLWSPVTMAVLGLGCAHHAVALRDPVPWLLSSALLAATAGGLSAWSALTGLLEVYAYEGVRHVSLTGALARTERLLTDDAQRREEMVHDARTVIAAARTASSTLLTHGDHLGEDDRRRLRGAVTSELALLERLIDRPAESELADVDLREVVEPLLTAHRASGALVQDEVPPLVVRANAADLATVVQNLLMNARRYAPGSPVDVWAHEVDGDVEVCVADRGPGIPLRERDAVFDRGARGRTSAGVDGSGLGLFISRRLMEAQGGTIEVRSRAGGGAVLVLTLPAAQPEAALPPGSARRLDA